MNTQRTPPAPSRIAVVDIGTNSTKFLIVRATRGGFSTESSARATTRIGSGVADGTAVSRASLERTAAAIRRFRAECRNRNCERVFAFATYALRRASNAPRVVRALNDALGCPLKILTPREEARFAFVSAVNCIRLRRPYTVFMDVGGGSTEIVLARHRRFAAFRSLPLGALHLTERFHVADRVSADALRQLNEHVDRVVHHAYRSLGINGMRPTDIDMVASGGSIATAARMIAEAARSTPRRARKRRPAVPRDRIREADVRRFLDRCAVLTLAERKRISGLDPDRADIIVAGLAIVRSGMRLAGKRVLQTNAGGVREGVVIHLIRNGYRW